MSGSLVLDERGASAKGPRQKTSKFVKNCQLEDRYHREGGNRDLVMGL